MEDVEYKVSMSRDGENRILMINDSIPVLSFYVDDIYARFNKLGEWLVKGELPPRDYTYGYAPEETAQRLKDGDITKSKAAQIKKEQCVDSDWTCLYCNYLDECWKEKRAALLANNKCDKIEQEAINAPA